MKPSILHQTVALAASLALVVMLTLTILSITPWLAFWIVAAVCLALGWLLRRN
jgi:hypothetical protein